jgi:hypothetical protein
MRADVIAGACTMAAVLSAFGIAYGLRQALDYSEQNVVLAVVLTLTLSRTLGRAHHHRALIAIEIPVLGLAAAAAGWLVVNESWIGQPLLALAMCSGLLTRQFGGLVRQAGRLTALPFLTLLVTPAPSVPGPGGHGSALSSILWAPVIGVIAVLCSGAGLWLRGRLVPGSQPPSGPEPATRRTPGRLSASTRMAAQMAVGLGVGLAAGHLLFGDRWSWTVLSAYIVASGNRGRGDVVHKAGLRVLGAGIGTVGVSLGTTGLPVGDEWLIVALFAVLAVALVLRERSYAFWAGGVTAMVALLHAYYGDTGSSALQERALGVIVGSAIAVAAAWFVLPIRTTDVLRRRVAECLAALSADLDPERTGPPLVPAALRALDDVTPAWRAHHLTLGRRADLHPVDVVAALHRLAEFPDDDRERRVLRRDIVRVRRSLVGKDDPTPTELAADLATVLTFIGRPPSP